MKMRVLHVTEGFIGGLRTALLQYIANCPQVEHTLVAACRGQTLALPRLPQLVACKMFRHGDRQWLCAILQALYTHRPDVLHAHSSRAGALVRVMPGVSPIVYSPHGFSFIRKDIRPATATAYLNIERRLAKRQQILAAVGEHEFGLASDLGVAQSVLIPHAVSGASRLAREWGRNRLINVGVVGRITAAKDPNFVAQAAYLSQGRINWTWAGDADGKTHQKTALETAGVKITGWLSSSELEDFYKTCDVVVLPSAWEATLPFAVLEPIVLGIPVVAKNIASLTAEGFEPSVDSPAEAVSAILRLTSPTFRKATLDVQQGLLTGRSFDLQRKRLMECYALALT